MLINKYKFSLKQRIQKDIKIRNRIITFFLNIINHNHMTYRLFGSDVVIFIYYAGKNNNKNIQSLTCRYLKKYI